MLTTDMFLTTIAPQTDMLLTVGAGAIATMMAFLAVAVAGVLGTIHEARRDHAPVAPAARPVRLAA